MCTPAMGEQQLIAGLCRFHYWGFLREKSYRNNHNIMFAGDWGNVLFNRNPSKKWSEEDRALMEVWFMYQDEHSDFICENCDKPLPTFRKDVRRSHHAHILPKEHFPSIKFNIHNHLTLGGMFSDCGCHFSYDASWTRASSMPVITIAKQKFLLLRPELALNEVKRVPEFFINQ
jgi:hypothetical protein